MTKQITFITADKAEDQVVADVAVFDADGAPVDMSDLGGVKQLSAISDVAADADVAAIATAFNGLLAGLRTAGILAKA